MKRCRRSNSRRVELEVAAGSLGGVRARVDLEVADLDDRVGQRGAAAQQRLQARRDLLERERLDDVVVGAGLQAADAVVDLVARRQDADGHVVAGGAQLREDLEAVEVGHPEVEQDHRRVDGVVGGKRRAAARRAHDAKALELESGADGAADRSIVVYEQHDGATRARRALVIHA